MCVMNGTHPRIAVLGCGGWGKNIIKTLERVHSVSAVADPDEAARSLASELAPSARIYQDPAEAIRDPDIDAIMIATPAETHYELALSVIRLGKDAFVEKPLTIDPEHARVLVKEADELGRVLMVGHLLEYHPAVLKLRELIESGELGVIRYMISNRLNLGKIRTRENALWSFAPHDIAVMLRLLGTDPIQIVCTGGGYVSPNVADVTVTQFLFESGARAHVFVSWLHPFKEQRLVVVGSKKMASFDDVRRELILYDQRVDVSGVEPVSVKGEGTPVEYDPIPPLDLECQHFIECVRAGTRARTSGADGVKVLRILHAAQRSLLLNGSPVDPGTFTALHTTEGESVRTSDPAVSL